MSGPTLFPSRNDITPELLARIIDYDPKAGVFHWKPRTPDLFKAEGKTASHCCNAWNAKLAGKPTFTCWNISSVQAHIFKHMFSAHRVAWAIHYGCWPDGEIDHIDGNAKNNRIANLRIATRVENMRNVKLSSANKSGAFGVRFNPKRKKWESRIGDNNAKQRSLGSFDTFEEARAARKAAERLLGYHANHGRRSAS